jgi:hypothetical protein
MAKPKSVGRLPLISFQFSPASSLCRHIPPAPGCHWGPVPCPRKPDSSFQVLPPSVERKMAASSMPA